MGNAVVVVSVSRCGREKKRKKDEMPSVRAERSVNESGGYATRSEGPREHTHKKNKG
jgi:hypothetical protein